MNYTANQEGNQHEVMALEATDEKVDSSHLEQADIDKAATSEQADAMRAEQNEHDMPLLQALKVYKSAILWSMAISLVIVMDGYDTGLLSSLAGLPPYRQKYGQPAAKGGYQLTPIWQTALVEAPIVGNIIGIFVSSWFQDRYGYRRTIQIFLMFLTGVIFVVFYAPTVEILFVGLLLCGLPWGAFSSVSDLRWSSRDIDVRSAVSYASEVMPISLRAYLTTYINLCWITGQLIASGVLVSVSGRNDQWAYRIPFAIQWAWPLPLFILATLAPESPWFYVRQNRLEEAERAVTLLAKEGESTRASEIVAMMVRTNQVEQNNRPGTSYLDCFKGADLRRTEIACLAWSGQILAGSSFANNPTYFLQQAGFDTKNSFNVGLGAKALAFIGTCGSWVALTYWGRRPVCTIGLAILAVCLLLVGGVSFAADADPNARWGSAALVLVWVFVYDFTVGPLAYAIVGESSSTRLRSKTVGLARNSYNVTRIIAGLLYTYQVNPTAWGWGGKAGFFWGGSASLICVWAYFRLPEFKGRSFRELDILFARRTPASKFKSAVVAEDEEQ